MASSHDLKELALAPAEDGFGSRVGMMKAGTPAHIAFTYLSAAFHLTVLDDRDGPRAERRRR